MSQARKQRLKTQALDYIKEELREGRAFANTYAVQARLLAKYPGDYETYSYGTFDGWQRQARKEVAVEIDPIAVTQPVQQTGWLLDPNATQRVRRETQEVKIRELATRVVTQSRFANAVAAQVDATPFEMRLAIGLDFVRRNLENIIAEMDRVPTLTV